MKGEKMEELEMRVNQLEKQNTTMYSMIKTEMDLIENLNRRCNILQECVQQLTSSLLKTIDAVQECTELYEELKGEETE
jgi:Mg2+ and Co2+ transporter CorA